MKEGVRAPRVENPESIRKAEMVAEKLFDISPGALHRFQGRVDRNAGHTRVSVHPLYIERSPKSFGYWESKADKREVQEFLREGFHRMLANVISNEKSAPLILFEEEQHLDTTKKFINDEFQVGDEALCEKGIVIAPTVSGGGSLSNEYASRAYESVETVPSGESYDVLSIRLGAARAALNELTQRPTVDESYFRLPFAKRKKIDAGVRSWAKDAKPYQAECNRISALFRERADAVFGTIPAALHMRSALISGGYFYDLGASKEPQSFGCGGIVMELLRNLGVKVDISRYVWEEREELEKRGIVTKETGGDN